MYNISGGCLSYMIFKTSWEWTAFGAFVYMQQQLF